MNEIYQIMYKILQFRVKAESDDPLQGQDQGGLRGQLRVLVAGGQHRVLLPRLHQGGRPHRIHQVTDKH